MITVRYVQDFELVERFLKFVELQDSTANGHTQALKENLDSLNLESKLIAQAYDGAAVMRGSINGVQVQIFQFNSIQFNSILFAIKVLRFEVLVEKVIAK